MQHHIYFMWYWVSNPGQTLYQLSYIASSENLFLMCLVPKNGGTAAKALGWPHRLPTGNSKLNLTFLRELVSPGHNLSGDSSSLDISFLFPTAGDCHFPFPITLDLRQLWPPSLIFWCLLQVPYNQAVLAYRVPSLHTIPIKNPCVMFPLLSGRQGLVVCSC